MLKVYDYNNTFDVSLMANSLIVNVLCKTCCHCLHLLACIWSHKRVVMQVTFWSGLSQWSQDYVMKIES